MVREKSGMILLSSYKSSCVRSIENAGITSAPPALIVFSIAAFNFSVRVLTGSWTRWPYVDSQTTKSAWEIGSVSPKIGTSSFPMSPEKMTRFPSASIETKAEPSTWPASCSMIERSFKENASWYPSGFACAKTRQKKGGGGGGGGVGGG